MGVSHATRKVRVMQPATHRVAAPNDLGELRVLPADAAQLLGDQRFTAVKVGLGLGAACRYK